MTITFLRIYFSGPVLFCLSNYMHKMLTSKFTTTRTAHEVAHLPCIAQAFTTCEDELSPIAQARENMCSSCSSSIARSGPNELAHVARIAHPVKTCADELSSMTQALKTCADELSSITQALKTCADELSPIIALAWKTCAAHVAPIAHPELNFLAHVDPIAHLGPICADELFSIV